VHPNASALFAIFVVTNMGSGYDTLFWSDRWLLGKSIEELAPNVFRTVTVRTRKKRTVAEALVDNTWVFDIRGALNWHGLMEYLELWDAISDVHLSSSSDIHRWKFESSGFFSSRSAYKAFFVGAIKFEPWKHLWKSWAPNKCMIFLWLAVRNRCWTANRLQKKGTTRLAKGIMCTAMAVSLSMSRTDISFPIKLAYMRMCYWSQYKSAKELARRKWQRA